MNPKGLGNVQNAKYIPLVYLDISRMSDSLYSLQNDIQRLALQQTQIQNIMNTGVR